MLTNDEILRLKGACGYNVVGIGAEFYSSLEGYVALFDRAIQPYLIDLGTTSTTSVAAAPSGATVAITLAANPSIAGNNSQTTAFAVGSKIVVDVGPAQEAGVVIQAMTGLQAYVQLFQAHGTLTAYPVQPMGAEYQVRAYLARLDAINAQLDTIAPSTAGIQQAGSVKIYGSVSGGRRGRERNKFDDLIAQRLQARRDLCGLLGVPYLPDMRRGDSGLLAI